MSTGHSAVLVSLVLSFMLIVACCEDPAAPLPPPPPPTIAEQIAAWNPQIIVEEPVGGANPSLNIRTTTPGDTITFGAAHFRIGNVGFPDSVRWTIGAGVYATYEKTLFNIPIGVHRVQADVHKSFRSLLEGKDTTVTRTLERTFVSLDQSYSLAIGKWVPVDPSEDRIDTLRVLYQEIIPGSHDEYRRNYVLGVMRGCDSTVKQTFVRDMNMWLRRYAVNFEWGARTIQCPQLFGELVLTNSNSARYCFGTSPSRRIDTIMVRRVL